MAVAKIRWSLFLTHTHSYFNTLTCRHVPKHHACHQVSLLVRRVQRSPSASSSRFPCSATAPLSAHSARTSARPNVKSLLIRSQMFRTDGGSRRPTCPQQLKRKRAMCVLTRGASRMQDALQTFPSILPQSQALPQSASCPPPPSVSLETCCRVTVPPIYQIGAVFHLSLPSAAPYCLFISFFFSVLFPSLVLSWMLAHNKVPNRLERTGQTGRREQPDENIS